MSIASDARKNLGLLVRKFREQKGWKRWRLERKTRLKRGVIARLEHGIVNPTRQDFVNVIKTLDFPPKEKQLAYRLLKIIHPRKRVKFHLPLSILRHRNRSGRW